MKQTQGISIIVPTYNGLHLLQKHLPSVFEAAHDGDEIIICDDASTDDTEQWVVSNFHLFAQAEFEPNLSSQKYYPIPSTETHKLYTGNFKSGKKNVVITLLCNKKNLRFAATVNSAVCLVKSKYFFLLNNDVSVEKNTINILKKYCVADDSLFAVGCLEYEYDDKGEQSGKNILWFEQGIFKHSKAKDFKFGKTAWASGGSALFSTTKWLLLKGFDIAFYPAYWEDIDISFRAQQKGWRVLFDPEAVVYHRHESTHATVFGSKVINDISWKNSFKFAWKHANFIQKMQVIIWYPYWQLLRIKHSV